MPHGESVASVVKFKDASTVVSTLPGRPEGEMDALLLGRTKSARTAMSKKSYGRHDSLDDDLAVKFLRELVASSPSQRNWRGIGIALLVILAVCSLIVTAVVLLTPGDSGPRVKGERFALDEVIGYQFSAPPPNFTWITDTEFVYQAIDYTILLYDIETLNSTMLVPGQHYGRESSELWFLSPDRKYVLLAKNVEKIFRYTFIARYLVYDVQSEIATYLGPDYTSDEALHYAQWGPVGNSLVFVHRNNVYYKASVKSNATRLTASLPEDPIFNGVPDWIYEEEILSSNHALWFSKDGTSLCVASFNDTDVPVQPFEWYRQYSAPLLYPRLDLVKYPKAGQKNPTVTLWVADVTRRLPRIVDIKLPPVIKNQEHYFTAVTWASNTELSVIWMNRRQNLSVVTICYPPQWFCNESYREETREAGWVDWYEPPLFSLDGSHYLLRGAAKYADVGVFRQVALKNISDRNPSFLTMGKWEVTKINAYDEEGKLVYYTVAPEKKPGERQLYRTSTIHGSSKDVRDMPGYCRTCHLAPDCLYVSASFSPMAKHYILECLGPAVPKRYLFESKTNKQLAVLEDNEKIQRIIDERALPQVKTLKVPVDGGYSANVRLLLPPELKDDEITQYPLIVNVYGGPGSQQVNEKFHIDWGTYLAGNKSYIYAMIDGRGSGFQGEKRKFELYRRLGSVEVEDQIAVTKYLRDNLHFVDKQKVGVWGWSYGGYVTAKIMATDTDVFKCGISVAPVTSWNYYDSVYTERYMGLPTNDDNGEGYNKASVLKEASKFMGKEYFLIHGTADDNVHVQQSMLLATALAHANVVFREQIYADENHGLGTVQTHLYLSMTDFLEDCFRDNKIAEIGLQALDSNKDDGEEN